MSLTQDTEEVKLWNARSNACLRTMPSGYVLCLLFLPGNKHILAGTKEGRLELFDASNGEMLESVEAHNAAVWSLSLRPDQRGVCSGSADKQMRFWGFELVEVEGSMVCCIWLSFNVSHLHCPLDEAVELGSGASAGDD